MGQDYLLRVIEQMAAVIAGIVAKRRGGDNDGAAREIQERCLQTIGLPLEVVRLSPPEQLAETVRGSGALQHVRAVLLAQLLDQDGQMHEASGNLLGALISYLQAACLLEDAGAVFSREEQAAIENRRREVLGKIHELAPEMGPGLASALPERFAALVTAPFGPEPT